MTCSAVPLAGGQVSYSYDAEGNKIAMTDATRSSSYVYDPDGEQLLATQGSTTIASSTWNGTGELTSYSDPTADMTSATDDGNELRASENSVPNGGSQVTEDFVWNTGRSPEPAHGLGQCLHLRRRRDPARAGEPVDRHD